MRGLRITNSFEDGTELSGGQQQRFNTHVYAQLARLMSRPVGRRLLRVILDSSTPEKQVLLRMFPLPQMLDNTKGARRIGAKAFPLPNQPSEFTVQDDNTIVKGAGAGSNVSLVPGIRDSTMMDHDMDGNKILSPSFIGLGHELIHSARYLDGSYVGMSNPHPEGVATQLPPGYHGDIEEFLTIASGNEREDQKGRSKKTIRIYGSDEKGNETKHLMRYTELLNQVGHIPTEAEIREEHGLSIRHGHSSEINPYRFGVLPPNTDPGDVVTDGVEWLNEFLNL
jgi:hypothetical protein